MDVVTAGTTQTQQAAGKTNHTPEDVSDLRLNIIKKASGKGVDKVPVGWYARIEPHFVTCVSSLKLAMQLLSLSVTTFNGSKSPRVLFNNVFCTLPVCSGAKNLCIHHQHV